MYIFSSKSLVYIVVILLCFT